MQPEISGIRQITLAGVSFYGDPFDSHSGWDEGNQIGRLWKRFLRILSQRRADLQITDTPQAFYEVPIYTEETNERGVFEVFVGLEIEDIARIPVELSVKVF